MGRLRPARRHSGRLLEPGKRAGFSDAIEVPPTHVSDTEDGRLEIDNNFTERTLRLCAISRKNWLFVGSDQGGETAATCFSILAGAKRHRIEPLAYVRALLVALASAEVDLESLLPDEWIKAHPEHFLRYRRDEAEAAAQARRRRRVRRRAKAREQSASP